MRLLSIPFAMLLGGCQLLPPILPTAATGAVDSLTTPLVQAREVEALRLELADFAFDYGDDQVEPVAIDLLVRINRWRQAQGRPPLIASARLMELAALRAKDMVANDYAGHIHPRRGTLEAERLLKAAGVSGRVAELLVAGRADLGALAAMAADNWTQDGLNHALLLSLEHSYVGAGVMGDRQGTIAVLLLAASQP